MLLLQTSLNWSKFVWIHKICKCSASLLIINIFCRLLTGKQIKKIEDAWEAIDTFHKRGCNHVVVTSSELGDENNLLAFASSIEGSY